MKNLIAEIPREDLELYAKLKETFVVELVKGKIRIYFQNNEYDLEKKYFNTEEAQFLVELFECGGGKTNTGEATIVCSEDGLPLTPVEIYTRGHLSNGDHARFLVTKAVEITVNSRHQCTITEYSVNRFGNNAYVKDTEIWQGKIESLPELFGKFENAVKVAYTKCRTYHCRSAHYISLNH